MFGGIGLLQGLIAALGAALFVGNVAALIRPPQQRRPDPRARRTASGRPGADATKAAPTEPNPPLRRRQAVIMAAVGLFILVWSVASLVS